MRIIKRGRRAERIGSSFYYGLLSVSLSSGQKGIALLVCRGAGRPVHWKEVCRLINIEGKFCVKPVGDLVPYERNPRNNKRAIEAVAECIKRFGFRGAIVIDASNVIICGHTRVEAAKRLGMTELPCEVVTDLTDEEIRAYRLADNKTAELANWQDELLAAELEGVSGIDMSLFGFDPARLAGVGEDEFDPEPPKEPLSRTGDIFILGRHRLIVGDALDIDVLSSLMDGKQADLYLTDPPYNVAYESSDGKTIQNDRMEDGAFREFLRSAFSAADSVMKPGAGFYVWHAGLEGHNFRGACHDVGWQVRQCLVWVKNAAAMGRQDYQWRHEPCLYGWKGGAKHHWNANRKQNTVLEFDKPRRSDEHPTMKPVALFDALIQNSAKVDSIILDTFAGSGTTVVACEQNNRICYCAEIDAKYADVIVRRYVALVGTVADVFLIRDGERLPIPSVKGGESLYE